MSVITQENLANQLASTSTVAELISLIESCNWNFGDSNKCRRAAEMIFDRGVELPNTFEEAAALFRVSGRDLFFTWYDARNVKLLDLLVSLATCESEIQRIYDLYQHGFAHDEVRYRNMIRKIFDRADELNCRAYT